MSSPNMNPDFEVKLLLDNLKVLDLENDLKQDVLTAFAITSPPTKINVLFLDTDTKEIYKAGWSPRLRKIEGKRGFELTYKKRYLVVDEAIDDALTAANADGFAGVGSHKFEAQIDWGYAHMTLSIEREKKTGGTEPSDMTLPDLSVARNLIIDEAPDKFRNYDVTGWGNGALTRGRIYGPVYTWRFIGVFEGLKMYVEVWPIVIKAEGRTEYVVEVSFKADTKNDAAGARESLIKYLQEKEWLVPKDSLRTQLIMDNY